MYPNKDLDELRAAVARLEDANRSPEEIAAETAKIEDGRIRAKISYLVNRGFSESQAKSIIAVDENALLRYEIMRDVAHRLRVGNYESLSDPFRPAE